MVRRQHDGKLFRRLSEEIDLLTSWELASHLDGIADELQDAGRIDETVAAMEEEVVVVVESSSKNPDPSLLFCCCENFFNLVEKQKPKSMFRTQKWLLNH